MEFEEVVKKRTATRKFSNRKVDEKTLEQILKIGSIAPTAKNLQPQQIYVLQSAEALNKTDEITPCRYNAPSVLLVCSDKNIAWSDDGYSSYETDACIVATHMILEATTLASTVFGSENSTLRTLKKYSDCRKTFSQFV